MKFIALSSTQMENTPFFIMKQSLVWGVAREVSGKVRSYSHVSAILLGILMTPCKNASLGNGTQGLP